MQHLEKANFINPYIFEGPIRVSVSGQIFPIVPQRGITVETNDLNFKDLETFHPVTVSIPGGGELKVAVTDHTEVGESDKPGARVAVELTKPGLSMLLWSDFMGNGRRVDPWGLGIEIHHEP